MKLAPLRTYFLRFLAFFCDFFMVSCGFLWRIEKALKNTPQNVKRRLKKTTKSTPIDNDNSAKRCLCS
jgi:hypothetical protein